MALVVRRVHDAVLAHCSFHVMQVLVLALDLAKNRIERMLQGAVELVALRRAQLIQIRGDLLARVLQNLFARKHRLGDVVQHRRVDYNTQKV